MLKKYKAYTIIEILLVLGVLLLLGFLALPLAIREIQTGKTDSFVRELNSSFKMISQDAFSGKDGKDYGIALFPDRYIIFIGSSLNNSEDELIYAVCDDVTIQNINLLDLGNEIVFKSMSQKSDNYGSFEIADKYSVFKFEINKEGLITFNKL